MIVQELNRIQRRLGYLPAPELKLLSERTGTPLYRLQEVASFFPHFHREPPPHVQVKVCRDMACHLRGASQLLADLAPLADLHGAGLLTTEGVSCLGRCDRAPAVCIETHHDQRLFTGRSAEDLSAIVGQVLAGNSPPDDSDAAHVAISGRPWQIDVYAADSRLRPYETVHRFIESTDRDQYRDRIIGALETAGLLGMGGAGGRTYKKWTDVRQAVGDEKYVVCNADESEPGTFKDRELLLRHPHLVLEGVILAGLLLNATRGYIYIRHEYQEQIQAVESAIRAAESMHVCGEKILGTQLSFPVEVFVSPGGYICGEQTALIEAMEDRRAEPRNRPPELQTNGLRNKPTLLNNVETLAWVPAVVLKEEGAWYAGRGVSGSKGMRFFSISGDVERPGVCEVPIGITFRELLEECGGMRGGQSFQAVALSGPSGGFLPRLLPVDSLPSEFRRKLPAGTAHLDIFDLKLDLTEFRNLGLMLGGGIVVYGERADMVDQALSCLSFFRNESCGKCVPCRIGSQKLVEIGTDLHQARFSAEDFQQQRELISDLAQTMLLTAICGLGTVAANPLTSLLKYFPHEVDSYFKDRKQARNMP